MKSEYRYYGRDSAALEENVSASDRKILEDYLQYCAITAAPRKIGNYRRHMLQFMDIVEKPLDKITRQDAVQFWALVNHSPYEEETRHMARRTVKRFLKWFYRDLEMIEDLQNPKGPLVNPKKINKSVLLTAEEKQRMLRAAPRIRDKALFMLLAETGARPQEIRDAKWSSVNWEAKEIHLYSSKTGGDRDLPIYDAFPYLEMWYKEWAYADPAGEDYIFPPLRQSSQPRDKPVTTEYINRLIKKLAKEAGIKRRIHSYLLRHTRLTELYVLGIKGIEHNKFAGHTPGSKHQNVYVHLDNNDLKNALNNKVYPSQTQQVESPAQPASAQQQPINQALEQQTLCAHQPTMATLQQQPYQQAMNAQQSMPTQNPMAQIPGMHPGSIPGVLPEAIPGALPGAQAHDPNMLAMMQQQMMMLQQQILQMQMSPPVALDASSNPTLDPTRVSACQYSPLPGAEAE